MANTGILHRKVIQAINTIGGTQSLSADIARKNLQYDIINIIADGRLYIVMFGESQDYYSGNIVLDALCLLASPKQAEIGDCVIESAFSTKDNTCEMYVACDIKPSTNDDVFAAHIYHTTQQFARHSDLFNNTKISYWKRIS